MTPRVLLFCFYFFLLNSYLFYSHFPSIGKFWYFCLSFLWLSLKLQRDTTFHCTANDYSCDDLDRFCHHLRDTPWKDIFTLSASAAPCEWVQVEIDVYISQCKYEVTPRASPWFPAVCAAVIPHRNLFFRLYRQNKFSASTVKFRPASNCSKYIFEVTKSDCVVKIFWRTLILITHVSLYLLSLLEIIWNCILFL